MSQSKVNTGQLPVYINAGGASADPLITDRKDSAPKGSPFASTTTSMLQHTQAHGPVVTTHNGTGPWLDVTRSALLGNRYFDIIKTQHMAAETLMMPAQFLRRFELRTAQQTVTPPVPLLSSFVFPRNAVWHFVSLDGVERGPDPRDSRIAGMEKRIVVSPVTKLTSFIGNPVPVTFNAGDSIARWHRETRVFLRKQDAVIETTNENLLPVVNYAWIPHAYRYTRSIFVERYRWENTWMTVLQNIKRYLNEGDEHTHFFFIDMPQTLVGTELMRQLADKPMQVVIRKMRDERQWMLFELWKWIDPETRHRSMFSLFSEKDFAKLRIVITDNGRFTVFNLELINKWTINPADLTRKSATVTGEIMQRRFLRGLMSVMEYRNPEIAEIDDFASDGSLDQSVDVDGNLRDSDTIQNPQKGPDGVPVGKDVLTPQGTGNDALKGSKDLGTQGQNPGSIDQLEEESSIARAERILLSMDDDLAALDSLSAMQMEDDESLDQRIEEVNNASRPPKTTFAEKLPVEEHLKKQIDRMADRGAITVVHYRKLQKLLERSQQLPSAYASNATMKEFADVKPEDTILPDNETLADRSMVVQKSMLQNSIKNFDKQYVEKVLPRDISGALLSLQRGGMIIVDHQVEIQEDAMNASEVHTVKYQPIQGELSTLRFKLPVISDTCRIKSNGTQSILRHQRVELPIRKVAYNRVSLTSYYGKTFVNLNERSAYNYDVWMQKEMVLKTTGQAPSITHALTGDVFDHTLKAPRAFSALSRSYRTFNAKGIDFFFDKKLRLQAFKPELYEELAKDKLFPVGRKGQAVYALDESNTIYECTPGENTPLESIESFLEFRTDGMPLEHAVCRIFSKDIPAGLLLGYYFGMGELIKMLGTQVRVVPAGTRVNAAPNEWTLVFEDQTIVFSRDDRLATLIFGGLKVYEKGLKRYAFGMFDQPQVYFQIVEFMGLNGRFIREFDMLRAVFVDSITERILIKMGEPTTYPGLVKRACEMLLTSQCSRKLDMREMRIRGAERLAGAVYTEIALALREHNAKVSKGTARVDLHPFAVWNSVTRDRAVTQVKDINPINAMKEVEAVTFSGNGGRSSETMMKEDRYFDVTDMGLIGEATPDSSEVGVSTYMVGVPRLANLEGMIKPPLYGETDPASLITTTALISPSSMKDD